MHRTRKTSVAFVARLCARGHLYAVGTKCAACSKLVSRCWQAHRNDPVTAAAPTLQRDGRSRKGSGLCKRGHVKEPGVKCRECNRIRCVAWYQRSGADFNAENKARYHSDPEYRASINARNNAKSKEYTASGDNARRSREWRAANRERSNAYSRALYQHHKDAHAAIVKRWKKANPETWRAIAHHARSRRRARLAGSLGSHTRAEWRIIVLKQGGKCKRCGVKADLEKDHIIPISRGGSDMAVNLQGLCKPCNASKSASIPVGTQASIFDRLTA